MHVRREEGIPRRHHRGVGADVWLGMMLVLSVAFALGFISR
jgi:hypothetical protein